MQKQKIFSAFTAQHQRLNFAGDGRKLEEEEGRRRSNRKERVTTNKFY